MICEICKREPGQHKVAKIPISALTTAYTGADPAIYAPLVDVCGSCYKKLTGASKETHGKADEPVDKPEGG